MDEAELAIVRRAYAKQITAMAGVSDPRMETALASVRREDFLGPGPWKFFRFTGSYITTPDDDPVHLYQDVLVGIVPEKWLNNGEPAFLTLFISMGRPRVGEHAVHIGAGVGYYTAIIAHLVGESGRVTAIEYEPELAARAAANLAAEPNVRVIQGDGSVLPLDAADVIYINAGASRPMDVWLDALKEGGRLVLPLTTTFTNEDGHTITHGAVFLIERRGTDYLARYMCPTGIYPCFGARDERSAAALAAAFKKGGARTVTRLYRTDNVPEERCWVRAPGWCLAYS